MLHIKYLVDRKTGLWFHGWTFAGRHHFANALWARGNCWVTIAIPEFIELLDLQPGDALREFLLETHLQQIRTLVKHQDKSGLWHTLIDDPGSYLEASAAAGFAYGILKSVRKRYIGEEYLEHRRARGEGGARQHRRAGELKNVSFGTPVFNDLDGYRNIKLTSMPYGQAMAILRAGRVPRGRSSDGHAARQVRFGNYIAYGANDFLGAGAMSIIGLWVVFFYTTYCGLTRGGGRASSSSPRACSTRSSRR